MSYLPTAPCSPLSDKDDSRKSKKRKKTTMPDFDEKYMPRDSILDQMRADVSSSLAEGESFSRQSNADDNKMVLAEERPIPLRLNPLENFDDLEKEKSPEPDYCFFCHCSATGSSLVQNPLYISLKGFCESHWGQIKDPVWLATRAQDMYEEGVRKFAPRDLPFYKRMILEHYLSHEKGNRFEKERTLDSLNGIKRFIEEKELFKAKVVDPDIQRANWPAIDRYLKICQYADVVQRDLAKLRTGGR